MIKAAYSSQRLAAEAVARSQDWTLKEDWSVFWCGDCQFWYDGENRIVEQDLYCPFSAENMLAAQDKFNLCIKPCFRKVRDTQQRFWIVLSSHGTYQRQFTSTSRWDALAQWLVGYHQFNRIMKNKVDLV